jgi:hypothetical protein
MFSTDRRARLGLIIILATICAILLTGILNTKSPTRISIFQKTYSVIISSNTTWMATGTIDTYKGRIPIKITKINGTYLYRNIRNPQEIYLLITLADSGLVENAFLHVIFFRGNRVILVEESRDFSFEFLWPKS